MDRETAEAQAGRAAGTTSIGRATIAFGIVRAGSMSAAVPRSRRRSLVWCSYEGMSAAVVGACSSGAVLTAWAVHLGASPLLLGTLWGLPYLAQVVQPLAACLTAVAGAKRVAVAATSVARQMLWVLAWLPLLSSVRDRHIALIACFAVIAVAGVVGNNAWTSWVAALVPPRLRGRYFGPRNARAMLVGTVASLAVGAYLDAAKSRGDAGQALAVTSAVGAAFGVVCTVLMMKQRAEPASGQIDVRAMLAPFAEPRARRVLAFQAAWSAATGIAASFYSAHALGPLGLGVGGFAVYSTALAIVRAGSTPLWGRVLDRAGARPVLVVCALLSAAGSGLWIATGPGQAWPIALDVVLSGVALSGMDLAVFMLPLMTTAGVATPAFVASAAMVAGAVFGGASIGGGALAGALSAAPTTASMAVRALFAASALGRGVAAYFALRLR